MDQTLIMAESKNTFTNSKMNKDLDDRLVPRGQYRDGQNITISASEGDDVGTMQNILGNNLLTNFDLNGAGFENMQCIGYFVDETSNIVYAFLTNYTDSSPDSLSNNGFNFAGAKCFVVSYDIANESSTILCSGNFLNFSNTHPIFGINLIEDLLFWTDNRNQPRKINIVTASQDPSYYDTEDKISVAKFYPSKPLEFYKEFKYKAGNSSGGLNNELELEVRGSAANAGIEVGMVVSSTTDQANLNGINSYVTQVDPQALGDGYIIINNLSLTWSSGDIITFTKYGLKNCVDEYLTPEFTCTLSQGTGNSYNINANQIPYQRQSSGTTLSSGMFIKGKGGVQDSIPKGTTITVSTTTVANDTISLNPALANPSDLDGEEVEFFRSNPDYNANFPGDKRYLKERFVKFSYRYKFDDGEYSLIAPFTQTAFIPEQDGYYIQNDEKSTAQSSIVKFFENKVNCIDLNIYTPFRYGEFNKLSNDRVSDNLRPWNQTISDLNIVEIEILISDASNTNIRVVDRLDVGSILNLSGGTTNQGLNPSLPVLTYSYNSQKAAQTLPSNELTRVYDKVPVRALSQESAGNRIIYGNFFDKHTSPDSLQFKVASNKKLTLVNSGSQSTRNLPNHSLKENRTYQVGIVLSDRYGRQSDVILTTLSGGSSVSGSSFGLSTLFHPYADAGKFSAESLLDWKGDQLLLYLETAIPEAISKPGYPGLYSESNPLGWYTYKIVVKQQEQEYYNTYICNAIRNAVPQYGAEFSYFSLINDNINKIPKDLDAIGPNDKIFSSSVRLHPRVNPDFRNTTGITNEQNSFIIFPTFKNDEVERIIENAVSAIDTTTGNLSTKGLEIDVDNIYKGKTATLATVSNQQTFGVPANQTLANNILGVYENNPVESLLDIYYETSTAGFVFEVNADINTGSLGPVSITNDLLQMYENTEPYAVGNGTDNNPQFGTVIYTIETLNSAGAFTSDPNSTCQLLSVFSSINPNQDISSSFKVIPQLSGNSPNGRFDVYANEYFYWGLAGQSFTFTVSVTANSITNNNLSFSGFLSNIRPQYKEQLVPSSALDNLIPVVAKTYENYTRTTGDSNAYSLRPYYYNDPPVPTQGNNKSTYGVGANSFDKQIYWLKHYLNNVETTYISNDELLYTLALVGWGSAAGATISVPPLPSEVPASFPIQSPSPATNIWINKSTYYTYVDYTAYPSGTSKLWTMLEETQNVSKFISQNGGIGFINGTLKGGISSTPTSTPTRDLTYTLSNFYFDGTAPGSTTYTSEDIAECVTINASTGVLNINDQLLIDKFGIDTSNSSFIYPIFGPGYPVTPAEILHFTVTVRDAGNSGAGLTTTIPFHLTLIS
tara:strand:+ start:681 stop:4718 length:4038 start_codon:yes stop_codon:yes gene_type:complete